MRKADSGRNDPFAPVTLRQREIRAWMDDAPSTIRPKSSAFGPAIREHGVFCKYLGG